MKKTLVSDCQVILASSSPRRMRLLEEAGFVFTVTSPETDETERQGEKPRTMVRRLAIEKGMAVANKAGNIQQRAVLILSADTIVVLNHDPRDILRTTILGKPKSKAHARQMLKRLQGVTHEVYTGYCLLYRKGASQQFRRVTRTVRSRVRFRPLSSEMIESYVKTGEPMDKAGGYAIQGRGLALVESIQGSYWNVVGLPVTHVISDLKEKFGLCLF